MRPYDSLPLSNAYITRSKAYWPEYAESIIEFMCGYPDYFNIMVSPRILYG
jgi:hypothetical protein